MRRSDNEENSKSKRAPDTLMGKNEDFAGSGSADTVDVVATIVTAMEKGEGARCMDEY